MSTTETFAKMSADLTQIDARLDAIIAERNELIVENEALRAELESMRARHPENSCADAYPKLRADMRSVVGELRRIEQLIVSECGRHLGHSHLRELLRQGKTDDFKQTPLR